MLISKADLAVLDATVRFIEADPDSSQSLLLYALLKTLSTEKGGHAFLLSKLREMNESTRKLAYGLMELMAQGLHTTPEWAAAVARIDAAIQRR